MLVDQRGSKVAKKKAAGSGEAKRYGTLVRVSDDFAESVRKVCALDGQSAAEFCDQHLLSIVQERYRELLAAESKKMGGKGHK